MTDEAKRLVESLREHAKWLKGYDVLSADLSAAADMIEELTGDLETLRERANRAEAKADALFYEGARLRSR